MAGSAVSAVDVLFGNLLLEWEECRGGWHRRRAASEAGGFIFRSFRVLFSGFVFVSFFDVVLGTFGGPFWVRLGIFFPLFFVSSFL